MSKKAVEALVIVLLSIGPACIADAYDDVITHRALTAAAIRSADLNQPQSTTLDALGLSGGVTFPQWQLFSPTLGISGTSVASLVEAGAVSEDYDIANVNPANFSRYRVFRHFFDPQQGGAALTVPFFGTLGESSPVWALEQNSESSLQTYSLRDARHYLRNALLGPSKAARDFELRSMFFALGHVMHHLQDMAQPQHVRNEDHCQSIICIGNGRYSPSAYERYTASKGSRLPVTGYPSVDVGTFVLPELFWSNEGMGVAEYTSNNFVGMRTNYRGDIDHIQPDIAHAHPGADGVTITRRQVTDDDLLGPVGPEQPLTGEIWFVQRAVQDRYRTALTGANPRLSAFSIYNNELTGFNDQFAQAFTLTRFNYDAAHEFLIPRAVGYSAGLLNYFFRGRIEIGLPDDGVFSVIDHAVTSAAGQGFTKLKVKLRNATAPGVKPDGTSVQQEMPAGKLTAIAKYIVNPCYQPDLLGEYDGGPIDFVSAITRNGCTLQDYFGGVEEIAVSAELAGQSLDRENAQEVTFDFSQQPIPIDAHDLSLQIVYEGVLGSEPDAIVVSGRNLSEPTYITLINGSDYFGIDGELYTPEEIRARDDLRNRTGAVNIDPEPLVNVTMSVAGIPIAGVGTLPAKGHHRIAVLTDAEFQAPETGPAPIRVEIRSRFSSGPLGITTLVGPPIRNQLARAPATLSGINIERRGITSWISLYRFKQLAGSVITAEKIDALPPMDPTCFDGANWSCVPAPAPIEVASQ